MGPKARVKKDPKEHLEAMVQSKEEAERITQKGATHQKVGVKEVLKEDVGTVVGLTGLVSAPNKVEGKEG